MLRVFERQNFFEFATEAALNIASFFIGVGEIKAFSGVSKTGKVLNAMDKTADALNAVDKGADLKNADGFNNWLNKGGAYDKGYYGIKDDVAKYSGITKQTTDARLYQHNKTGKSFSSLDVQYDGLTRNQARSVEQYLIKNGPNELNKINSIGPKNKYYNDALEWAQKYVEKN